MHYIDFTACDRADRKEIEPMDETILAVGAHGKFAGRVFRSSPDAAQRCADGSAVLRMPPRCAPRTLRAFFEEQAARNPGSAS